MCDGLNSKCPPQAPIFGGVIWDSGGTFRRCNLAGGSTNWGVMWPWPNSTTEHWDCKKLSEKKNGVSLEPADTLTPNLWILQRNKYIACVPSLWQLEREEQYSYSSFLHKSHP